MAMARPGRPALEGPLVDGAIRPADLDEPPALPSARPLEVRVAAARQLRPPADTPCKDCWLRGRDAAIRAVAAATPVAVVAPTPAERHNLQAFRDGRDQAGAVLAGEAS